MECPECGAIVGKDIIGLPHVCSLRDKFIHSLKQEKTVE
jgi:hypothetical protein